jgi:hypothetical protein
MPMTPGLVPNLRLDDQEEQAPALPDILIEMLGDDPDKPKMDQKGNVLEIEHGDGSISISLDGRPINKAPAREDKSDWFRNLAEEIPDTDLYSIADGLIRGIDQDQTSRQDWVDERSNGLRLLGLKVEIPGIGGSADGAPVEGMSRVRHPLLLEAVLRFQANARSELLPTDGPVKIRNDDNNATLEEDQLGNALEQDMNHYLTSTAKEYYPDTDRMLLMLGFGGTAFKKVYYCPLRNRPVSESVDADDLIVNNAATDLSNAKRVTHRVMMRPSVVKRLQILGVYRDVDLSTPAPAKLDSVQREKKAQQGIAPDDTDPEDRDREIYECYCELDLVGFEHKMRGKETGLEIPYRVTIDLTSKEVLSIVRNYDEDSKDLPEAKANFVKYTFVPGFGFYDIGLLNILGNTTNAITAAWRELLDAGMYANFPGFLFSDQGLRQNTNIFRVPPGGGASIKTGGMDIRQAIMPLPYKEPSAALMTLVANMADTGMRLGGTSEQQVGEGRADAPVGTTLAMIEQATKILNSVHKRMHAAQAEEFRMLMDCFKDHPESFWQRNKKPAKQWDQATFLQALEDCDLVPQADPNTSSHAQRVMKIMALKQLQQQNPTMYDPIAIDTAALQAIGWSNPQQFLLPVEAQGKMPPEMQQKIAELEIKKQDADNKSKLTDAKVAETAAKIQQDAQGGQAGGGVAPFDPMKLAELQLKQMELREKSKDSELEAMNRKRDRESHERLAAIKFAESMAKNPQGIPIADAIVRPDMIQRLEENEEPMNVGQPGQILKPIE